MSSNFSLILQDSSLTVCFMVDWYAAKRTTPHINPRAVPIPIPIFKSLLVSIETQPFPIVFTVGYLFGFAYRTLNGIRYCIRKPSLDIYRSIPREIPLNRECRFLIWNRFYRRVAVRVGAQIRLIIRIRVCRWVPIRVRVRPRVARVLQLWLRVRI